MRRAATISAAKMALCVINIIPPAWAQDRPDVVDRSTEDTNPHVSQLNGRSLVFASNRYADTDGDTIVFISDWNE